MSSASHLPDQAAAHPCQSLQLPDGNVLHLTPIRMNTVAMDSPENDMVDPGAAFLSFCPWHRSASLKVDEPLTSFYINYNKHLST